MISVEVSSAPWMSERAFARAFPPRICGPASPRCGYWGNWGFFYSAPPGPRVLHFTVCSISKTRFYILIFLLYEKSSLPGRKARAKDPQHPKILGSRTKESQTPPVATLRGRVCVPATMTTPFLRRPVASFPD